MNKTNLLTSKASKLFMALLVAGGVHGTALANTDLTSADANRISASAENTPGEGRVQAFDDSEYSKWLTFNPTGWISYDFGSQVNLSEYTVTSANDVPGRDPRNWTVEGSNDGQNWFQLDQRSNQSFASRYQKNSYSINNAQSARYVRFNVTQNNGAGILQLAELEFFGGGSNGAALPVNDSGSLAKNEWQHYGPFSSTRPIIATTSGNGDVDLYMRRGAEATTKYSDCESLSAGADETCTLTGNDIYVSVHAYSDIDYSISIVTEDDNNNDLWIAPNVDFMDMNPETAGSQLVNRILGNPAQYMADRCIDVAQVLYTDPAESSRFFNLQFELRALDPWGQDFVAYKVGADGSGEMTIAVSTAHLERVYAESGNNDAAIRDEIDGILFHEITHGYNNSPLTTDSYGDQGPFWAYTEGLADGVRIGAGFHKTRSPDVNGSRQWLGGYTTTGFFLHYISERIDPLFIRKFNQSAADMGNYTWSWDASFRLILGRGVQDVWNEYRDFINNGGQLNY